MKFLLEKEVAFAPDRLGFPSISGCHAIVYQNSTGIYGYHNAGGSDGKDWSKRATAFAGFVRGLGGLGGAPGTRLYGVTFASNNGRCYRCDGSAKAARTKWKEELVMFASKLQYSGKISGYDLKKNDVFSFVTPSTTQYSAYVEFRVNGTKCDVYIRVYNANGVEEHPLLGANPDNANHKWLTSGGSGGAASIQDRLQVASGVNRNNLVQVSKEKLR